MNVTDTLRWVFCIVFWQWMGDGKKLVDLWSGIRGRRERTDGATQPSAGRLKAQWCRAHILHTPTTTPSDSMYFFFSYLCMCVCVPGSARLITTVQLVPVHASWKNGAARTLWGKKRNFQALERRKKKTPVKFPAASRSQRRNQYEMYCEGTV